MSAFASDGALPLRARRFAEGLANDLSVLLGTSAAGVILHGSLVLGGYVPGRSDVGLLVVVDGTLSDAQVGGITALVAGRIPAAPGRRRSSLRVARRGDLPR
jgi:hypothetical protein